jgi:hypothetical protein
MWASRFKVSHRKTQDPSASVGMTDVRATRSHQFFGNALVENLAHGERDDGGVLAAEESVDFRHRVSGEIEADEEALLALGLDGMAKAMPLQSTIYETSSRSFAALRMTLWGGRCNVGTRDQIPTSADRGRCGAPGIPRGLKPHFSRIWTAWLKPCPFKAPFMKPVLGKV